MDLKLLRVFLAVYDARSVSHAAAVLDMHQSGVSGALKQLRAGLGDPLFVRTAKAMQPTPAADRLAAPLRSALASIERAVAAGRTFVPATTADELRILTGDVIELPVLAQIMPILTHVTPRATIRSMTRKAHEIEGALEKGEIDFAIGQFPSLKSGNLFSVRISKFVFGFFCRPGHPLAGCKPTMEEFCSARHVAVDAESSVTAVIERWLAARHIVRNIVVRTSHFDCVPELIQITDLVAVLPTNALGAWLHGGTAVRIVPPFAMPEQEVRVYWHRTVHEDARHRWWRETLVRELRQGAEKAMRLSGHDESIRMFRDANARRASATESSQRSRVA